MAATATAIQASSVDLEIANRLCDFVDDPLSYVRWAYPWGEADTILERETGPDPWQADVLKKVGYLLKHPEQRPTPYAGIQIAARSGHGIGKTALMAHLIQWFISTKESPEIIVTANTKEQLTTKTWRELAKWHGLMLHKHWFKWTATKYTNLFYPETWFAHAVPWSISRPESFQGSHEKWILVLFDEASAIEDPIWESAEGAMTTPNAIWIVFGNPTRNTGRFFECFNRFRDRWVRFQIDSRNSLRTDKQKIRQWIEDYGEDSDFVRVRVKGEEPRAGMAQFIPTDLVKQAIGRPLERTVFDWAPRVLGVDPARFGDDKSVITRRQGLKMWPQRKFRSIDTMQLVGYVIEEIRDFKPKAVFVDVIGIGAGVVDRLNQLGYNVIEVNNSEEATENQKYTNKRVECWARLKKWLKMGASIPDDIDLRTDLTGPEYGFDAGNRYQLEKKEDMKARGLDSPDCADSLAVTFAESIQLDDQDDGEDIPIDNLNDLPGYY